MNYNNLLIENKVDAIWVTEEKNKRYLTNFSGSTCEVIIKKDKVIFITDGRYKTQIKSELKPGLEVIIITSTRGYFQAVKEVLEDCKTIGVEGNHLSVIAFNNLKKDLNSEVIALNSVFEKLRMVKSEEEINKIKEAVKITDETFSEIVEFVKPGMTEIEVKVFIEGRQILKGASGQSFDPIVSANTQSALPHADPTNNVINEGDILTVDFGCVYDGYCSDMTRTFFVGKPREEKLIEIHNIVNETMNMQIKMIKPGIKCNEVDKLGRDYITSKGYGEYFIHGTGHSFGMDIHEAPYLNQSDTTILEEGMIVTVEPGIYIEGLGGVRIEQDVVVTKDGYEVLNKSSIDYNVYNK